MQDFFADLYDNDDDGQEPTFSLYDFKKWLSRQKGKPADLTEARHQQEKDVLREQFKERFKDRLRKKRKKR